MRVVNRWHDWRLGRCRVLAFVGHGSRTEPWWKAHYKPAGISRAEGLGWRVKAGPLFVALHRRPKRKEDE